ncbi:F1F0 ATP synthase subunit gamma [Saccharomycopsis crataegensis]|uniref:ATP synthase subunit gamma n=1 Tax=Saccharomycopsis crataegensis TaxID=43959 RepID=A0AAV5QFV2_9ASCO|nr:F1F0 ATP synthase subunit gamma [Saccharomycopsis crataegensis]
MFARAGVNAARTVGMQSRNYATLREIEMRLKSIKNIEKITKTMKIVASTRLGRAQKAMALSRVYDEADSEVYTHAESAKVEQPAEPKSLIIAVSSDKGLCGSIHSQIGKATKKILAEKPTADVVVVGDKIKAQVQRSNSESIVLAFNGTGKAAPTFVEASLIADEILKLQAQKKYDSVEILYNKFVSSVSFAPTAKNLYNEETIKQSKGLSAYELDEDSNVPVAMSEFSLANSLLVAMAEGHAAEISARRNAMDNASKNAGEMINKYSILYNRTRQAVITNELVDIITGASSLD